MNLLVEAMKQLRHLSLNVCVRFSSVQGAKKVGVVNVLMVEDQDFKLQVSYSKI